jgi:hypothetical protein
MHREDKLYYIFLKFLLLFDIIFGIYIFKITKKNLNVDNKLKKRKEIALKL